MSQVFISYSRKDLVFVEQLAADLKQAGLEVWYDLSRLEIGERWGTEIANAIRSSQYIVVVLSPDSIQSEWVEREVLLAGNLKKRIVPIIARECELPIHYLNLHTLNVADDHYRQNFPALIQALNAPFSTLPARRASPATGKPPSPRKVSLPLVGCLAVLGMVCVVGVIASFILLSNYPLKPSPTNPAIPQPLVTEGIVTDAPEAVQPSVTTPPDLSGTFVVLTATQNAANTQSAAQTTTSIAGTQMFDSTQAAFAAMTATAGSDVDGDGLTFNEEINRGTDPTDADSDNDQLNDGREISLGTNPNVSDSDGDGIMDGLDPNPRATETPTKLPACKIKTVAYNPTAAQQQTFLSQTRTKGDNDFGGNGPEMTVDVRLRTTFASTTRYVLDVEVHLYVKETKSDWTTFDDDFKLVGYYVIDVESGYVFEDIVSRLEDSLYYKDFTRDNQDVLPLSNLDGLGPVKSAFAVGDSTGNDLGKTKAVITFKALQVKVKQSGGCTP